MEDEPFAHQEAIGAIGELTTALATHALSGAAVIPATCTRRVASSITNSATYRVNPVAVHTSTVKKPPAASTC